MSAHTQHVSTVDESFLLLLLLVVVVTGGNGGCGSRGGGGGRRRENGTGEWRSVGRITKTEEVEEEGEEALTHMLDQRKERVLVIVSCDAAVRCCWL